LEGLLWWGVEEVDCNSLLPGSVMLLLLLLLLLPLLLLLLLLLLLILVLLLLLLPLMGLMVLLLSHSVCSELYPLMPSSTSIPDPHVAPESLERHTVIRVRKNVELGPEKKSVPGSVTCRMVGDVTSCAVQSIYSGPQNEHT
jgi:hypothetical protein